ncbi:hypothetical protein NHJ13051_003808 [Beauveria bassiana]
MGIYMCFSKTLRIQNTNKLFAFYIATGQQMLMGMLTGNVAVPIAIVANMETLHVARTVF